MFEYTYATFMNDMEPSKNYVVVRRSEGVNDFVTYCYIYFGGGGYFIKQLRNSRHKILELGDLFLACLVRCKIIRMKSMDN